MSHTTTASLPLPTATGERPAAADLAPRIRSLIAAELRLSEDLLDDDLTIEDLGFDSLTSAEVLLAIEKQLGCSLDASSLVETLSPDTLVVELIQATAEAAARSWPGTQTVS